MIHDGVQLVICEECGCVVSEARVICACVHSVGFVSPDGDVSGACVEHSHEIDVKTCGDVCGYMYVGIVVVVLIWVVQPLAQVRECRGSFMLDGVQGVVTFVMFHVT